MFQWDVRALEILDTLERAGHQAVLVGGCVRDALLGREPHDYDAAVSAPPEEILAACRSKFKCIPTGLAHGTVTVVHGGLPVEVTAFRKEGTYSDHRHPDRVAYTSRLEEDLARRDFTVNAMAWGQSGLIDPFGGQKDLAAGVIRCVGEPDRRFQEDALRVLRGLRLAAQLDFRPPSCPMWPGSASRRNFSACCAVPGRSGFYWTSRRRSARSSRSSPRRWALTRKIPTTAMMCTPTV